MSSAHATPVLTSAACPDVVHTSCLYHSLQPLTLLLLRTRQPSASRLSAAAPCTVLHAGAALRCEHVSGTKGSILLLLCFSCTSIQGQVTLWRGKSFTSDILTLQWLHGCAGFKPDATATAAPTDKAARPTCSDGAAGQW